MDKFKQELKPDFKRAVNLNKNEMFSIHDKQAQKFGIPFPAPNKGAAVRQLAMELQQQNNVITKYPQDFDLYLVEEFDETTGKFQGFTEPIFVMCLKDIVTEKN